MNSLKHNKIFFVIAALAIALTALTSFHKLHYEYSGPNFSRHYSPSESTKPLSRYPYYLREAYFDTSATGHCYAFGLDRMTASGWPLYYEIDDPVCGTTHVFLLSFIVDTLLFALGLAMLWRSGIVLLKRVGRS